jgi:hypothetical protein
MTKEDELVDIIKGKEEIQVNSITTARVDFFYVVSHNFNPH